ncbi:hypothetical protein BS78_K182700 [Paspalum vaginatum]|uniref:Uncharacterized protein n=1 Tax=Paspalum vaginatum TaxID=158149 RepID=A0A9W7X818_9POAL|nr:hypothetical protein BS78_K182700 [Paspalum vaginatum]
MVAAAQHHGGSAGTTELSGWRRLLSLRRRPCNSSPQISPPTVRPWTLPPALATTASASKSLMAWYFFLLSLTTSYPWLWWGCVFSRDPMVDYSFKGL